MEVCIVGLQRQLHEKKRQVNYDHGQQDEAHRDWPYRLRVEISSLHFASQTNRWILSTHSAQVTLQ